MIKTSEDVIWFWSNHDDAWCPAIVRHTDGKAWGTMEIQYSSGQEQIRVSQRDMDRRIKPRNAALGGKDKPTEKQMW